MARRTAAQIKAEAESTVVDVETAGINDALFKLQGIMPAFQTDEVNPHLGNKYMSINNLMPKLLVLLRAHGVLLVQSVTNVDGEGALRTKLTHVSTGESFEDVAMLAAEKTSPQRQGSAITYMRRYALVSLLNIVIEKDDDGHSGSQPTTFRSAEAEPPASVPSGFGTPSGDSDPGNPFGKAL